MAEKNLPDNDREAALDGEAAPDDAEAVAGMSKKKKLVLAGLALLAVAGGAAGWYFLSAGNAGAGRAAAKPAVEEETAASGDAEQGGESAAAAVKYLPFDTALVVNVEHTKRVRFLQVNLEVMSHDDKVLEAVKTHMPAIRNSLVLLLSNQDYKTLSSSTGKEQLRAAAREEIGKILAANKVASNVEAVFFTGFVMQ
jgi:flagellar FliL protein